MHKYFSDETVVIYRLNRSYLVDQLLPRNTSQALHIVPYPSEVVDNDKIRMEKILQDQIYNSWWNGYLLGYPDYFIDSYCFSFHTTLSRGQIEQQVRRAKSDVHKFFDNSKLERKEIGVGYDTDILNDDLLNFMESFL
jgi:hypothetical protein